MARAGFLYLFGISCVLAVLQIEAKLTQIPSDTLAPLGDSVTFRCFTENKVYPPSWYHTKVGSSEPRDVYTIVKNGNGNGIVGRMTQEYHERMEVLADQGTGEYSLKIKSVQSDDAGQYRCTAKGGLGQSASAQLTVIKSSVQCQTNSSELLGEHVCDHEPDNVKLSCSFEATGNYLPNVSWVKSDNMSEILIKETAIWSNDRASASSSFVLRADEPGLHGSSYMCIISEPDSIPPVRLSCTTSTLHVIKLKHVFGTKTLESPAEVRCPEIPRVTETGSKWIRRTPEQSGSVIIVTNDRTLNLYRPEMIPGDYACMIDCNIGNKQCEVEALTVNYKNNGTGGNTGTTTAVGLNDRTTLIITTVVVTVFVCIAIYFAIKYRTKFVKGKKRPSPPQSTASTDLSDGTRSSQEQQPLTSTSSQNLDTSSTRSVQSTGDAVPCSNGPIPVATDAEHNNGTEDKQAECDPLMKNSKGDVEIDMPDAKIGRPGDRNLRLRQIEERARARMQMNAELRQGERSSPENGDVAEGLQFNIDKKDL